MLQPLSPGLSQRQEVGVLFGDAVLVCRREAPLGIDQGIQGQAHRKVAAQGRVDGDEGALQGGLKRRLMVDDAVDDGLAVLALTNLEVGGVDACLDEVALRIDVEQAMALPPDLPPQQDVAAEVDMALLLAPIPADDGAYGLADEGRDLVEAGEGKELLPLRQQADDALGSGQIAGALQHQHPVLPVEEVQFAEGGDVIHPRIGARVGGKHHAVLQAHGDAVGHETLPAFIAAAHPGE